MVGFWNGSLAGSPRGGSGCSLSHALAEHRPRPAPRIVGATRAPLGGTTASWDRASEPSSLLGGGVKAPRVDGAGVLITARAWGLTPPALSSDPPCDPGPRTSPGLSLADPCPCSEHPCGHTPRRLLPRLPLAAPAPAATPWTHVRSQHGSVAYAPLPSECHPGNETPPSSPHTFRGSPCTIKVNALSVSHSSWWAEGVPHECVCAHFRCVL